MHDKICESSILNIYDKSERKTYLFDTSFSRLFEKLVCAAEKENRAIRL